MRARRLRVFSLSESIDDEAFGLVTEGLTEGSSTMQVLLALSACRNSEIRRGKNVVVHKGKRGYHAVKRARVDGMYGRRVIVGLAAHRCSR
jgi:hypothetical protein